jgi:hypothetical protein
VTLTSALSTRPTHSSSGSLRNPERHVESSSTLVTLPSISLRDIDPEAVAFNESSPVVSSKSSYSGRLILELVLVGEEKKARFENMAPSLRRLLSTVPGDAVDWPFLVGSIEANGRE